MVPLGPRLVFRTSCKPLAALIFMCRAADLLSTSAFGFRTRMDIFASLTMILQFEVLVSCQSIREREREGQRKETVQPFLRAGEWVLGLSGVFRVNRGGPWRNQTPSLNSLLSCCLHCKLKLKTLPRSMASWGNIFAYDNFA